MNLSAQQIRQHRKARGMTQAQLAAAAGLSTRMIQDAESGRHTPQPENMKAIAAALEVEGEEEATRQSWPADITVFLDIMGAFLNALPEDRRAEKMRQIINRILEK